MTALMVKKVTAFDFRKLMVISYWWSFKKGREFNAFVFYVDSLIWVFLISLLLTGVFMTITVIKRDIYERFELTIEDAGKYYSL
jgi:hypothetical protein